MLTQKELKDVLHYNPKTGFFSWKIAKARTNKVGSSAGYMDKKGGYLRIGLNYKYHSVHRLAWLYVYGKWPENQIDHIDHDRQNNRISNLRNVTRAVNMRNQKKRSTNTSGVTGVYWDKASGKWQSRIMHGKKLIFLGNFSDKFEAVCARKSASARYGYHENHGDHFYEKK